MAKERTKSLNDIQSQSSKIKDELLRRAFSTQDMDKRAHYTKLYQQADNAARRYQDNIRNTKAYRNSDDKQQRDALQMLRYSLQGNSTAANAMRDRMYKDWEKVGNRKYKGYQNAATTSSVG